MTHQSRISELENKLIQAQSELLEKNRLVESLQKEVKNQRRKRHNLAKEKQNEFNQLKTDHEKHIQSMKSEFNETLKKR